ncbi:tRNA (N6-threonylcarbamoyladenosine(37)-N6)-methyltransferase TrmO [Aliiroseovarius subalbicans]|uniref:tRNA (N6-threonylcarbamoyladenosine(37)-N6)-methyltransferase TrmO n=1 Tax=Aliiroseovarius subalbicans TaxID=2925840 RepID=UPI001F57113D|nr:tRNA (N6-threonylcarbamoyladenosine(37)-N6)-methyltransferase TrmO [Aliiroseovarius subalbicans]MCI2399745.1 tRNA (N6-threonylcarbamoyladenosine(37)-N6)-methyltransferase TrmO [Aliiroseovarius subalbicans]
MSFEKREGEVQLAFDPGDSDGPRVAFIGHVRSRWQPGDAPRNIGSAREAGGAATVELEPGYAQGLQGLEVGRHIIVLYWMDRGRRDLIVQSPRHTDSGRGVFSLRSPVRPNPIAMSTVRITALDMDAGVIGIDAIDCFDGTPVVDIKPWIETIDMPQG